MKKSFLSISIILMLAGCTGSYNVDDLPLEVREKGKTEHIVEWKDHIAIRNYDFVEGILYIHKKYSYNDLEKETKDWVIYKVLNNVYFYNKSTEPFEAPHIAEPNTSKAIIDYTQKIEINPNSALTYYNRGILYLNIKEYSKAIIDFDKTIELNPNDADSYYSRGCAHQKIGNKDKACEDWQISNSLGNEQAQILINEYCK